MVLEQIESMREQAQPAIGEGRRGAAHGRKSFDEGRKGAAHGAAAISLASKIDPKASSKRGGRPPIFLLLVAAGGIAYVIWKRRQGQHAAASHLDQPAASRSSCSRPIRFTYDNAAPGRRCS